MTDDDPSVYIDQVSSVGYWAQTAFTMSLATRITNQRCLVLVVPEFHSKIAEPIQSLLSHMFGLDSINSHIDESTKLEIWLSSIATRSSKVTVTTNYEGNSRTFPPLSPAQRPQRSATTVEGTRPSTPIGRFVKNIFSSRTSPGDWSRSSSPTSSLLRTSATEMNISSRQSRQESKEARIMPPLFVVSIGKSATESILNSLYELVTLDKYESSDLSLRIPPKALVVFVVPALSCLNEPLMNECFLSGFLPGKVDLPPMTLSPISSDLMLAWGKSFRDAFIHPTLEIYIDKILDEIQSDRRVLQICFSECSRNTIKASLFQAWVQRFDFVIPTHIHAIMLSCTRHLIRLNTTAEKDDVQKSAYVYLLSTVIDRLPAG